MTKEDIKAAIKEMIVDGELSFRLDTSKDGQYTEIELTVEVGNEIRTTSVHVIEGERRYGF